MSPTPPRPRAASASVAAARASARPLPRPSREMADTSEGQEQVMNDEFESALFVPDVILPSQISVDARWASDMSGPVALMLAVLADAVRCIERGNWRRHAGNRKQAAEAATWVLSDSREWPFAFASICDVLGLDVGAVRARLLVDGECPTGRRRHPGANMTRGRGRTSVCPARPASQAA